MEHLNKADIGIFWAVDDCPIPESLNALMVSQNMRLALENLSYHGKVFIHAYGDSNNILDDLIPSSVIVKETPHNFDYRGNTSIYTEDDPDSTPVLMLNHSSGNNDAMLGKILVDFMMWAVDHPAPAQIILILGDNIRRREEEFIHALCQVDMLRYNIHFAYPQNSEFRSLPSVHMEWLWETLSVGGLPLSSVWEEEEEEEEE